jgi:uncharacterized membrane protein YidH (DUF202 family)
MVEIDEQETLAEIRTLLALERNYLAEERTAFAELRTGLTLAVVAPPASVVIAYLLPSFLIEKGLFLDILVYTFFAGPTILGIWMGLRSRARLRKVKKKMKVLRNHITKLSRSFKAGNLLNDYVNFDD